MSNVKHVINSKGEVVYEHKLSGPDPDFYKLAIDQGHGLPLLHIDHDDGNRLIALVESIERDEQQYYPGAGWRTEHRTYGKGGLWSYDETVAERWRSEMVEAKTAFGTYSYWTGREVTC